MIINLPKLGAVKFRDDLTTEEFDAQIAALAKKYDFEKELRPDYGPVEGFTRGVSRGFKRLGSTVGDVLPAMGASALGFDEYAQRQMEEARQTEQDIQKYNPPEFRSFKEVEGVGDAVGFVGETAGEQLANLATVLGTGGAGALAGRAGLGVFLGSYSLNAPEVFQNVYQETGQLEPGVSALFGAGAAALDSVLPATILSKLTGPQKVGIVEAILKKSGMDAGLARKGAANVLAGLGTEGVTEGAQEAISISAEKFVADNPQIFDSEDFDRIMESSVRGAVAGGTFRGVSAVPERFVEKRAEERTERGAAEFLAQEELAEQEKANKLSQQFEEDVLNINTQAPTEQERQQRAQELGSVFNENYINQIEEIEKVNAKQEAETEKQNLKQELNEKLKTPEGVDDIIANMDIYFGDYSKAQRNTIREDLKKYKSGTGKYKGAGLRDNVQREYEDVFADVEPTSPDILTSQKLKEDFGLSMQEAKTKGERDLINNIKDKSIGNPAVRETLQDIVDSGGARFAGKAQEKIVNAAEKILNVKGVQLTLSEKGTPKATVVKPKIDYTYTNPVTNEQTEVNKGTVGTYKNLLQAEEQLNNLRSENAPEADTFRAQMKVSELTRILGNKLNKQFNIANISEPEQNAIQAKLDNIIQQEQQNEAITRSNSQGVEPAGEPRPKFDDTEGPTGPQRVGMADTTGDVDTGTSGARVRDNTLTPSEGIQGDLFPIQKQAAERMETLPRQRISQQRNIQQERTMSLSQLSNVLNNLVGPVKPAEVTPKPQTENMLSQLENAVDQAPVQNKKLSEVTSLDTENPSVESAKKLIQAVESDIKDKPKGTPQHVRQAATVASRLPSFMQNFFQGLLSMANKVELYGKRLPAIKSIQTLLENRALLHDELYLEIQKMADKALKLLKKTDKATRDKFNKVTLELSRLNIDPRDPKNANVPLVKQFKSLPQELQNTAISFTKKYEELGDRMFDIFSTLSPKVGAQLKLKFQSNRVAFYHPLRRQGDHWLYYIDQNGEAVAQSFRSIKEREEAIQALPEGIDQSSIRTPTKIENMTVRQAPPAGFMGQLIKLLQEEGVSEAIQNEAYQMYLSLFPTQSLQQQFKGRKGGEGTGIKGYTEDVLQGFVDVGSRMARQLSNVAYRPKLDEAFTNLNEQYEQQGSPADLAPVMADLTNQRSFLENPVAGPLVNFLGKWSYFWYIGGNVSSALINTTQLPMTVYPMLGGEYGYDKATVAMASAQAEYFKGGLDETRDFFPDYSYGVNATGELKTLYDEALKAAAIRRGAGAELQDLRGQKVEDYNGAWGKTQTLLSWIFQNSERYNREITLIAAFKLARQAGDSVEVAIQKAIDLTVKAHSHALPEAGPRLFQQGPGKVFFTFKRFAQAQIYNVARLATLALSQTDPTTRKIAAKQLMGIMGMTWAIAGVVGLPAFGAVNLMANALYAMLYDDDEMFDLETWIQKSAGTLVARGGINELFGIDVASRTGYFGMVWRDEDRRLQEVGYVPYVLERLGGPSFQILVNAERASSDFRRGEWVRGVEQVTPLAVRNVIKGMRYMSEGALTRDGIPLKEDFTAFESAMQLFGFTSTELSERYQKNNALSKANRLIQERKSALLDSIYLARKQNDTKGVERVKEKIRKFNSAYPSYRITPETIYQSRIGKDRRIRESTDGIYINPKLRRKLEQEIIGD